MCTRRAGQGMARGDRGNDREALKAEIEPIQTELRRLLEDASPKSKRTRWHRQFANILLKVWPALWTFVSVDGVEPTNNPAERALRAAVIHRTMIERLRPRVRRRMSRFGVTILLALVAAGAAVAVGAVAVTTHRAFDNTRSPRRAAPPRARRRAYQIAAPLPDTSSGFHRGQPFNYNERTSRGVKVGEQGVVDYVWGAEHGRSDWNISGGTRVFHEAYIPWARDQKLHTTAWWKAHHLTWIEYTAANHSTVATTFGQDTPILDVTNPHVQVYIEQQAKADLGGGFQGVSWDNGLDSNGSGAGGHYGATGNWVQQYSGALYDQSYADANNAAFKAVVSNIHASYPNASDTVNQRFECVQVGQNAMASESHMVLDEGGFTDFAGADLMNSSTFACSSKMWLNTVRWDVAIQNAGHGMVFLNEESSYKVTANMTDSNLTARADLEYAMANYFLVKYAHAYFWWGGNQQYGGPPASQAEYAAAGNIGYATDDYYATQNVYARDYSNGLTLVNPDPSKTYTVHLSKSYKDLRGKRVSGSITLRPHSGAVLLSGGRSR